MEEDRVEVQKDRANVKENMALGENDWAKVEEDRTNLEKAAVLKRRTKHREREEGRARKRSKTGLIGSGRQG